LRQDVEDFVRTTGLPQYQETFRENFIDGRRLLKLKRYVSDRGLGCNEVGPVLFPLPAKGLPGN
jgi:hypothetical protein